MHPMVFYIGAGLCAALAAAALAGRSTQTRWSRRPFLEKVKREDGSTAHNFVGAGVYTLTAAVVLCFGLELDGRLSGKVVSAIAVAYVLFLLALGLLGILVMKFAPPKPGKATSPAGGNGTAGTGASIYVGDIPVLYGVTTPQIFEGSPYRVAYDTAVQEPQLPFVTCQLQRERNRCYVGDLIFDACDRPLSEQELRTTPILQVHLDRRAGRQGLPE